MLHLKASGDNKLKLDFTKDDFNNVVSGQDLGNSDNDVLMVINDGDDDEMIRQEYRQ